MPLTSATSLIDIILTSAFIRLAVSVLSIFSSALHTIMFSCVFYDPVPGLCANGIVYHNVNERGWGSVHVVKVVMVGMVSAVWIKQVSCNKA